MNRAAIRLCHELADLASALAELQDALGRVATEPDVAAVRRASGRELAEHLACTAARLGPRPTRASCP